MLTLYIFLLTVWFIFSRFGYILYLAIKEDRVILEKNLPIAKRKSDQLVLVPVFGDAFLVCLLVVGMIDFIIFAIKNASCLTLGLTRKAKRKISTIYTKQIDKEAGALSLVEK